MSTGLDCDGTASISGGTFIQLGAIETSLSKKTGVYSVSYGSSTGGMGGGFPGGGGWRPGSSSSTSSSNTFSSGTWTISNTDLTFTIASGYTYYGCVVYSSLLTSGTSYTVTNGSTSYSGTAS